MSDTIQRFPRARKEDPYHPPEVSFNADVSPTAVFISSTVEEVKGAVALGLLRLALQREVDRIIHDHEQAYKSVNTPTEPPPAYPTP